MPSNGRGRTITRMMIGEMIVAGISLSIGVAITKAVADRGYVFGSGIWSAVFILITCGIGLCCIGGSDDSIICALACNIVVAFVALIEVILSSVFAALMSGCRDCKSSTTGGALYWSLSITMCFELVYAIVTSVACCCGCCCCDESSYENTSVSYWSSSDRIGLTNNRSLRNNTSQPSAPHMDGPGNNLNPSAPHMDDASDTTRFGISDSISGDGRRTVDDGLPSYNDLEPPPTYNELFPSQNT